MEQRGFSTTQGEVWQDSGDGDVGYRKREVARWRMHHGERVCTKTRPKSRKGVEHIAPVRGAPLRHPDALVVAVAAQSLGWRWLCAATDGWRWWVGHRT